MAANLHAHAVPWERLDAKKAMIVVVDHQAGLFHMTRDWDHTTFKNNMLAHAAVGKLFDLPVVLTTSAETGPNGPLAKELIEMYPDAPLIKRGGEISAWDNAEFRKAVKDTGRTQIIIAGIVTDVCTSFLALGLRADGYTVFANVEASGTLSVLQRDTANDRMRQAGVFVVSLFYITADLLRDWRNPPGAAGVLPMYAKYIPAYGMLAQAHLGAITEGAPQPGEDDIGDD